MPGRPVLGPAASRGATGPGDVRGPGHAPRVGDLGAPLALGLAGLAAVAWLALTDPYRPGGHLACPLLALTGLYCAGCGAQRAVHDLAHLDLGAAWGANPLVVLGAPVVAVAWARWLRQRWAGRASGPPRAGWAWALAGVVVVFTVLRNVPALTPWLAP